MCDVWCQHDEPLLLVRLLVVVDSDSRMRVLLLLLTASSASALAGGFGRTNKQRASNPRKGGKRGSIIVEQQPQPTTTLDKWGLPPPTEDDIFPPPTKASIPVDHDTTTTTTKLAQLQDALREYTVLHFNWSQWDDEGVETEPPTGCAPMRLRLVHQDPPVLVLDDFLTPDECWQLQQVVVDDDTAAVQVHSQTVSPLATSKRTSTSWFCHYASVPVLLAKAQHRLGITLAHVEEPQIVRYQSGQEFSWHYDALPSAQLDNGGQRLATLLVYLNTVERGGATVFRDLQTANGDSPLSIQPVQGSALLFFPSTPHHPDDRTLHRAEVAEDEKNILQVWVHERPYTAALPPGNTQEAAYEAVEQVSRNLWGVVE